VVRISGSIRNMDGDAFAGTLYVSDGQPGIDIVRHELVDGLNYRMEQSGSHQPITNFQKRSPIRR
jgi:hypothetical protein